MNNHFSPQTIEHKKRARHMALEIQILTWDRHKHAAMLNWLMHMSFFHLTEESNSYVVIINFDLAYPSKSVMCTSVVNLYMFFIFVY